jgi:hypothetical protein
MSGRRPRNSFGRSYRPASGAIAPISPLGHDANLIEIVISFDLTLAIPRLMSLSPR